MGISYPLLIFQSDLSFIAITLLSRTDQQHQISTDVKLHIAFCIFGVVGRAIEWTWPTLNTHLIEPLESAGFRVTIYVFNMQVGATKVDNNYLNANAKATDVEILTLFFRNGEI